MTEGRYTISEIDRMRDALRKTIALYWVTNLERARYFPEAERAEQVEKLLRTHMVNGTPVEDIEAEAVRSEAAAEAEWERRVREERDKSSFNEERDA